MSIETCAREQKSEDTYIRPYCVEPCAAAAAAAMAACAGGGLHKAPPSKSVDLAACYLAAYYGGSYCRV